MIKLKNPSVVYNKCGHHVEMEFTVDTDNENSYIEFFNVTRNGINDYCDKCKAINTEYGMIRKLITGDYDRKIEHYTFNHTNIRQVVRYFWEHGISLHDEFYPVNSPYDCTGQCFQRDCKVKRFEKHITVRFTYHYDL